MCKNVRFYELQMQFLHIFLGIFNVKLSGHMQLLRINYVFWQAGKSTKMPRNVVFLRIKVDS